jgi:23S rRNA (pseudouridine1915-N3)-methyltransferase
MLKINIIAIGRLSIKYLNDGVNDYIGRIKRFYNINVIELPEVCPQDDSEKSILSSLEQEGIKIRERLEKNKGVVIALAVEGNRTGTEEFVELITGYSLVSSTINFVIGSHLGLSESVKKSADYLLSLSDMTMTHQFARLMLVEQIYRAATIEKGMKYHRG